MKNKKEINIIKGIAVRGNLFSSDLRSYPTLKPSLPNRDEGFYLHRVWSRRFTPVLFSKELSKNRVADKQAIRTTKVLQCPKHDNSDLHNSLHGSTWTAFRGHTCFKMFTKNNLQFLGTF